MLDDVLKEMVLITEDEYTLWHLFSLDEITGGNIGKFTIFLEARYDIEWVRKAKVDITDNGKTLNVYFEDKSLLFRVNNEKTRANLTIYDGRGDEFIIKTENDRQNVYLICKEYPIPPVYGKRLIKLVYDNITQIYKKQASFEPIDANAITVFENSIFVATSDGILRFNTNLEKEKEFKINVLLEEMSGSLRYDKKNFIGSLNLIDSLASSDKCIFISTYGNFITLDKDFKKLDNCQLADAHDILIYKNMAYLLDDIVYPLYLIRVNIEYPENIHIIESILVRGVNHHLYDQWINPEHNQWLVIQTGNTWGCYYQNILIYPLMGIKKECVTQEIYRDSCHDENIDRKNNGLFIEAVTQFSPAWAVVKKDGRRYLAEIGTKNDRISFSNFLDLGLKDKLCKEKVIIKQFGYYLYIVAGKFLRTIDLKKQPKVIISQELNGPAVDCVLI